MTDYRQLPTVGTALRILEGDNIGINVLSSSVPDTFSRNMSIVMANVSRYLTPTMTAADQDSIDYAKFSIQDEPGILDTVVRNSDVSSLEYMLFVTECITRSTDIIKKKLFLKYNPPKDASGRIVFVKWLAYAVNIMEHKHISRQDASRIDEDRVEEMVVSCIMELICSLCQEKMFDKSKKIEVVATNYRVKFVFIVEQVIDCARKYNISSVYLSATKAKRYLDAVLSDAPLETFVPQRVLPHKETLARRSLNANRVFISSKWSQYACLPTRKAKPLNRSSDSTRNSAREIDQYSNHTSNFKRGASDGLNVYNKRSRSDANSHFSGQNEAISNLESRGREPIPVLRAPNERARHIQPESAPIEVVRRTSLEQMNAPSDIHSIEGGQGRGRAMTMPAWMTRDVATRSATSSGSYAPSSVGLNSLPDTASFHVHTTSSMSASSVGVGRGIDGTRQAWQSSEGQVARGAPSPNEGSGGRGRGRGRTLPAWMT